MGFDAETIKKLEYAKQFEKQFGTPDPDHDWSMATLVKASVNLPGLTGTAKMNICTGDPHESSTRLLAQVMLQNGQASFDFDAIKGNENVFVTVEQDGQYKVFGQYHIYNGMLQLGNSATRSVTGKSDFSDTCPTTQGAIAKNVFTDIDTEVKKYHYNGEYYSLKELRDWATENYPSTDVSSHDPFTSASCVISGTYDFTSATLNTTKVTTISESGYLYKGNFYTESELRAWANAEASAGRVTSSNYTTETPFTDATVKPAGYDYSSPVVNTEKATPVTGPGYYFYKDGALIIKNSREELIAWSKENETYFNQYTLGSKVFVGLTWDSETNSVDYSTGEINTSNVTSFAAGTNYIFDNKVNSLQDLIDYVETNKAWMQNNGPLTNVYFDQETIDFTTANLDNTKVTSVAAGNYIYDGQVFISETALQDYTRTNNLDNDGPYLGCCSGSHLDFTDAVVDEALAPFEYTRQVLTSPSLMM